MRALIVIEKEKVQLILCCLFPCVFTHSGHLSVLLCWECVLVTQDIYWRSLTGSSLDIIPGELAVALHHAISKAENISLTNYLCIRNIIVSIGQMLSLATWSRFLSCSFPAECILLKYRKTKLTNIIHTNLE